MEMEAQPQFKSSSIEPDSTHNFQGLWNYNENSFFFIFFFPLPKWNFYAWPSWEFPRYWLSLSTVAVFELVSFQGYNTLNNSSSAYNNCSWWGFIDSLNQNSIISASHFPYCTIVHTFVKWGSLWRCHSGKRTVPRDKDENPVQIDFVNLYHTWGSLISGSSLSAYFKHRRNWGKVSKQQSAKFQVYTEARCNYTATQKLLYKVQVTVRVGSIAKRPGIYWGLWPR